MSSASAPPPSNLGLRARNTPHPCGVIKDDNGAVGPVCLYCAGPAGRAHSNAGALTDGCARSDSGLGHYGFMRYDATTNNAIEATGLVKRFGKTTALDGVDLVARQGRVLGVLGPNGAGKTTAVRILATLLRPDDGQASICGYDVLRDAHQVRQLIGLTGQYASVDEGLSGINNLIMIGRLLGLPRRTPGPGVRVARPLRADRRRRAAGEDLFGRHAPPS